MDGLRFGGLTISSEAQVGAAALAATLVGVVGFSATTLGCRLVGVAAVACASLLVAVAAWRRVAPVRVFLSPCVNAEEAVTLLRLRDLASAHGIRIEISRRDVFRAYAGKPALPGRTKAAIDRSHLMLVIITGPIDLATATELAYGKATRKLTVPIVGPDVETRAVFGRFPYMIRTFPQKSGERAQAAADEFLQGCRVSKRTQKTVRTVVGISLALLSER